MDLQNWARHFCNLIWLVFTFHLNSIIKVPHINRYNHSNFCSPLIFFFILLKGITLKNISRAKVPNKKKLNISLNQFVLFLSCQRSKLKYWFGIRSLFYAFIHLTGCPALHTVDCVTIRVKTKKLDENWKQRHEAWIDIVQLQCSHNSIKKKFVFCVLVDSQLNFFQYFTLTFINIRILLNLYRIFYVMFYPFARKNAKQSKEQHQWKKKKRKNRIATFHKFGIRLNLNSSKKWRGSRGWVKEKLEGSIWWNRHWIGAMGMQLIAQ